MDEAEVRQRLNRLKVSLEERGYNFDIDPIERWIAGIRRMGKGYIMNPNVDEYIDQLQRELQF